MRVRAGGRLYATLPAAAGVALTLACAVAVRTPELHAPPAPPSLSEARSELKVHLKSGELLVLREWSLAGEASHIEGMGQRHAVTRERVGPEERQSSAPWTTSSARARPTARISRRGRRSSSNSHASKARSAS